MSNRPRDTLSPDTRASRACVELLLPAAPKHLRLARLAVAALGHDLALSLEEIDDLRIGVDELCGTAITDVPPTATLHLRFTATPGFLRVEGDVEGVPERAPMVIPAMARELLRYVTDDVGLSSSERGRHFWLHKRIVTFN